MTKALLHDLPWRFNRAHYPSVDAFVQEVADYSRRILDREPPWSPDEIIIPEKRIRLRYEAVRGDAYDDAFVQLETANPGGFTAAEFLWRVHEALTAEDLADHCFFEGVSREAGGDPPLYSLFQGS